MADIYVHHITATIADTNSSVTLTEGTDYTLQRGTPDAQYAFARVMGHPRWAGASGATPANQGSWITYSTDITASLTVNRHGTSGAHSIKLEIWEYTGSASGAHEFIVREENTISMAASTATASEAVTGVVTDEDVVVFYTGSGVNSSSESDTDCAMATFSWDSANNEVDASRLTTTAAGVFSFACVEFTGSSWTVQSAMVTSLTADGSEQTVTLGSTLTAVAETMAEFQFEGGAGRDDSSAEIWVSATTTVSYIMQNAADTTSRQFRYYLMENPDLTVTRYSGSASSTQNVTLSPTVTLTEAAVTGFNNRDGNTSTNTITLAMEYDMTSGSNVTLTWPAGTSQQYRFEASDFSALSDAGGTTHGPLAGEGGLAGPGGLAGQTGILARSMEKLGNLWVVPDQIVPAPGV